MTVNTPYNYIFFNAYMYSVPSTSLTVKFNASFNS